jgi:hypothetical protein
MHPDNSGWYDRTTRRERRRDLDRHYSERADAPENRQHAA